MLLLKPYRNICGVEAMLLLKPYRNFCGVEAMLLLKPYRNICQYLSSFFSDLEKLGKLDLKISSVG